MTTKYKYLLPLLSSFLLTACMEDNPAVNSVPKGFEASASIECGTGKVSTRVATASEDTDDGWSFTRFSSTPFRARPLSEISNNEWEWEEALGFFSKSGNMNENEAGTAPFINEKMIYARSLEDNTYATFISGDMQVQLANLRSGSAAYFPYVEDIEEQGIELRWVKDNDLKKIERCIDALIMRRLQTEGGVVSGMNFHFYHAFSSMIISRGDGFSNPPEGLDGIKVCLEKGFSHARLVDYSGNDAYKIFEFYHDPSYQKTEEECREWKTWKSKYSQRENGVTTVKDVWFVLLPGNIINRPMVEYIEIYDDYGILHHISDFALYQQSDKSLYWNERYSLEIKMEGLVPTANPMSIQKWGEDIEIAKRQASGISNQTEFEDFVNTYNNYASRRTNANWERTLAKYGDVTIDENSGDKYWHFYITNDIEFNDKNGLISLLHENDIIDGLNCNLSNVTNEFITTLKGTLQNLNFKVNINDNISGNYGPIVKLIQGGIVSSCNVSGTVNCKNASVGMLAGDINGGSVINSTFSGLLIGKSHGKDKILGSDPSESDFDEFNGNSSSGVMFTSSN